ncbi:hypothetical protein DFAR_1970002 [Desulfarculales bacterium]
MERRRLNDFLRQRVKEYRVLVMG